MMIKITPLDTLFFRTGRPFSMGEDTWAEILFPPNPSTLYGAIRSYLIFQREGLEAFKDGKYKDDIGTPDKKGSLKLKGPFLSKDNELYFPTPLDLVAIEDKLVLLTLTQKPLSFISDYPLSHLLVSKSVKQAKEPIGWLNEIDLRDYLKNKKTEYRATSDNSLFLTEPKIGIARDRTTLTSKEGYLYRTPLIRVKKGCSLVIEVEGIRGLPPSDVIQLGGERKIAYFEAIEDRLVKLRNIEFDFKNNLFRLYLVTPAIFEKGWLPKWIDENTFEGKCNGLKLRLVCCTIGKPLSVGGWDIAKNRSKPLLKAVPAGSVYYFEILDGSEINKIKEAFHLNNISDINPEEGFGLSLIGEVKI